MAETLTILGAKYLIALPVAAFAGYLFFISKDVRIWLCKLALISLPLAYVLARVAGLLYSHPQPFVGWEGEPLVPHEIDNAFPSDHVLLGSALALLVGLANRYWGAALLLMTALIALARVAAGLHSVVDVIASFVLAGIAVWIASVVVRAR